MIYINNQSHLESVELALAVNCGSIDEKTSDIHGISHFIEHMMFKGTTNRTSKEIFESVELCGGSMNAYTSKTRTVYTMTVAKQDIMKSIDIMFDMISNPIFPEDEFNKEREVVLQEILRTKDSSYDFCNNKINSTFYSGTNYDHPVIGYEDVISNLTLDTLNDYYNDNYFRKNISFFIVGNVEKEDFVKNKITEYMESIQQGRDITNKRTPIVLNDVAEADYENSNIELTHNLLLFNSTDKQSLQSTILNNMVAKYISHGFSSPMFKKTREEHPLCYNSGCYYEKTNITSNIILESESSKDNCQAISDVFQDIIANTPNEVNQARVEGLHKNTMIDMDNIFNNTSHVMNIAVNNYFNYGKIYEKNEYMDTYSNISYVDVAERMRDIFKGDQHHLYVNR